MGGFNNPGVLAASAAGLISALLMLWATHGLPLGGMLVLLSPGPLFGAGLAFGPWVAAVAMVIGGVVVGVSAGLLRGLFWLALFAAPAWLLTALFLRGGMTAPLAALALYPAGLMLAGFAFLDVDGIDTVMRAALKASLAELSIGSSTGIIEMVVRLKGAVLGVWLAMAAVGNAILAQRLLVRRGLNLAPTPDLADARMPGWYLGLIVLAGAAFAVGGDGVTLSLLLLLLLPFFLMGVAGIHRRLRANPNRVWFLAGFYALLLILMQIMAPAMVGMGLYEQWARRASPPLP